MCLRGGWRGERHCCSLQPDSHPIVGNMHIWGVRRDPQHCIRALISPPARTTHRPLHSSGGLTLHRGVFAVTRGKGGLLLCSQAAWSLDTWDDQTQLHPGQVLPIMGWAWAQPGDSFAAEMEEGRAMWGGPLLHGVARLLGLRHELASWRDSGRRPGCGPGLGGWHCGLWTSLGST